MEQLLQLFIIVPLLGFLVSLFFRNKDEKAISLIAITTMGVQFFGLFVFVLLWIRNGSPILNSKHFTFYKEGNIEIPMLSYFRLPSLQIRNIKGDSLFFNTLDL